MRKFSISAFSILVALLPIITLASYKASSVSAYTYQDPFHPNSIWNAPIPSNVTVASNSAQMIQQIRNEYGGTNLPWTIAGVEQPWGVPVYYADSNTPRVRVCGNDGNYCTNNVPIASNFYPSPDSDAKIVIIETNVNPQRAWSFWGFRAGSVNGSQYISDYGAYGWSDITDNGDGLTLNAGGQWGGRASGANYIGGLIDPEEIQSGVIDHALAISFTGSAVSQSTRWWPARGGDGYSTNANAVPYGARIQLDPSFDINTIPTTNGARAIARALQTYGAWVMDTGGSFALYAREYVNSNGSINRTPWNGLINASEIESYIPWTSLRVLTQQDANNFYPIATTINRFAVSKKTEVFNGRVIQAVIGGDGWLWTRSSTDYINWTSWTHHFRVQGEVVAMHQFNSRLFIAVRGTDNRINSITTTDGINWSGWVQDGMTKDIINYYSGNGRLFQIVRGVDDGVWYRSTTDGVGWSAWSRSGMTKSKPEMISFGARTFQFVWGTDNGIWYRSTTDGINWSVWETSGMSSEGISLGALGTARLLITVKGIDGRVWYRSTSDGSNWSNWENNGMTASKVEIISYNNSRMYQILRGTDNGIWYRSTTDGLNWNAWTRNGSTYTNNIVTKVFNNIIYQSIKGTDNGVWVRTSSDGLNWSAWTGSGTTNGDIEFVLLGTRVYQNVIGTDRNLWARRTDTSGTNWESWLSI